MNNFNATAGNMQIRLEGGYQFNTKPISLNKTRQQASKKNTSSAKNVCQSKKSSTKNYDNYDL